MGSADARSTVAVSHDSTGAKPSLTPFLFRIIGTIFVAGLLTSHPS
jgi:hypothetical protein